MTGFIRGILVLAVALTSLSFCPPARAGDDAATAFQKFCDGWMKKLELREADNLKGIVWKQNGSGVEGEYVGYSHEHTCNVKAGDQSVPIGKVTYREHLYRRRGKSREMALTSAPQIVEITEVTEIFRYAKGKWVY